ncbi:MAG TPA: DDE-type integrase/transposase/recombinase [Streptosporangiaceae bacterium]|nr:DDE-type integrase/transposase/recombinase [Streptosporangiaceae bacterium]
MATQEETERKARLERARVTGLFRYSLVQELIVPGMTGRERGSRARELAGREHRGPDGSLVRVTRHTIDRWRRDYEAGGSGALVPSPRQCSPRSPAQVLDLAAALKREKPGRTAAQVRRILAATSGWAPPDRTLQRLSGRLELSAPPPAAEDVPAVSGRFECTRPNGMQTGDTLHGPVIAGDKPYLACFIDDHSRAVMGARWSGHDDVVRMAAALRPALASRGVPENVYLGNGSPFAGGWLLRGCAVLGIRLIHSRPGKPEGRGKIERFFRTVRDQFLAGIGDGSQIADLAEMNRLSDAWVQTCYHRAVHSETGEEPLARWAKAGPGQRAVPSPAALHEAFLWPETRKVTKTATVPLHGNTYQAGAWLARKTVELVFDPFDLTRIEVRLGGKPAGTAAPFIIGRHRHAKTRTPDAAPRTEPEPAGIDYLDILSGRHDDELRAQIRFTDIIGGPGITDDGRDGDGRG